MNKTLKLTGIQTYDTYVKKCNNILDKPDMSKIKEWLYSLPERLRPATIRTIKSRLKSLFYKHIAGKRVMSYSPALWIEFLRKLKSISPTKKYIQKEF